MILAIVGPTGVGKTKLSVELAKKYDAVVVNCDAVQVYKELNIGSAKPSEEEKEGVTHLLFDFVSPNDYYTVKDYQRDLRRVLEENVNRNIIIVGGTGMYLCAGLFDYQFEEENNNDNYDILSNEELYKLALKKDANCLIHPNNRVRLIRFLRRKENTGGGNKLLYDVKFIGLTLSRDKLYNRIDERVDKMVSLGLLDEVKKIYQKYPSSHVLNSAIGYKEIIAYLNGEVSLDDAITLVKKNSRHYAKRQYTWFNNKMNVNWFSVNLLHFDETITNVEDFLEK
jgi:tRNA dimethylallyltransferase